jgi:hypothetical protein
MLPERVEARAECATLRLERDSADASPDTSAAPVARIGYEPCRPVPEEPYWFESVWRDFNDRKIFD